jgi:aspartokinase
MSRIKLGGIKIAEGRAWLTASCRADTSVLPDICARLAASRINLSYLTHLRSQQGGKEQTAICTDKADGHSSYFLLKVPQGMGRAVTIQEEINILSIFPHDQRPAVTGKLLEVLARENVPPYGVASSPSAMSFLVSSATTARMIDALFEVFEFPAYPTPFDWHAAYQGREQVLKEIICSYQEQVIKVYTIGQQNDLELWYGMLPLPELDRLGAVLTAMDQAAAKMVFLTVQTCDEQRLMFSVCFARSEPVPMNQLFDRHLPALEVVRFHPAAALFLHGPHFGDRYGISHALVQALHGASIKPLALSCAVSSISVIVPAEELDATVAALDGHFEIPPPRAVKK